MPRVLSFPNAPALARAAAKDWLELLARNSGPHLTAVSGGRIAKDFFQAAVDLAGTTYPSLRNVHFFWADERCVPPTDSDSNFLLAEVNLLKPLGIAADRIHRLQG